MESATCSPATPGRRPRLYGIVHNYIQKHLPRDIHPAFSALRDREEAATSAPQRASTQEASFPLLAERGQVSRADHVGGNSDGSDHDDLPLYVVSQIRRRICN